MKMNDAFLQSLVRAINESRPLDLMKTMRGCLREGVPLHVMMYLFGAARAVYSWDKDRNRVLVTGRGGLPAEAASDALDGHILIGRISAGNEEGTFTVKHLKAVMGVPQVDVQRHRPRFDVEREN
jgi:hypothetical protein